MSVRSLVPSIPRAGRRRVAVALTLATLTAVAAAGVATSSAAAPDNRAAAPSSPTIGAGWTLATWTPGSSREATGRESLFLVSPSGERRLLTHVPRYSEPLAISPTGNQVLIESNDGTPTNVDLQGRTHAAYVRGYDFTLGYTPSGRSLLVSVSPGNGTGVSHAEIVDPSGRPQLSFVSRAPGAGAIDTSGIQQTADGRDIVAAAQHGLVVMGTGDGKVTRRLATSLSGCSLLSWWQHGTVLASCGPQHQLYTVPLSGGAARRISRPSDDAPFGYVGAWRTGGRPATLGLAGTGCGPATLVRFDSAGRGTDVTIPSPVGVNGTPGYVSHVGTHVVMTFTEHSTCQQTRVALFDYDAQARTSTALLGPTVNGGSVVAAVGFPTLG